MKILFTLCGRAGSKGFKNKNLKSFLGKPLIYHSISAIALYTEKYADSDDRIDAVLNTDSEELIQLVMAQNMYPFSVIRREEALGGDAVPKVAVIKDCLNRMEVENSICYDIVVDLDITSPLRTAGDVARAIEKKVSRPDTDVVYSVVNSRRNPYFNMVKETEGFFGKAISSEYTMRQQAPVFYDMNASIYVYSVRALREKEEKTFFNDHCDAVVMPDTGILDIDSEEDYELMQVVAEYLYSHKEEYGEILVRIKDVNDGVKNISMGEAD